MFIIVVDIFFSIVIINRIIVIMHCAVPFVVLAFFVSKYSSLSWNLLL